MLETLRHGDEEKLACIVEKGIKTAYARGSLWGRGIGGGRIG